MSLSHWRAGAVALVILLSACDPPGKPGAEEDEAAVPTDFKTVYAGNCSGCHGANGRQGPGRVLNDPLYLAVSSKNNIRNIIVHGRPGTLMPAFAKSDGGQLNDQQIDSLVNGIESDWAKPFNTNGAPLPSYDGAGFTGDVTRGKKAFYERLLRLPRTRRHRRRFERPGLFVAIFEPEFSELPLLSAVPTFPACRCRITGC